jgi:pimeloyl-ACP methyl ester carboxylesterase
MNVFSCEHDPRLSYFFYAPKSALSDFSGNGKKHNLAVLIHGSERSPESYRNSARRFADFTDSVILAPLFPAGLSDFYEIDNFNLLRYKGIEFDTALLRMIDELGRRFPIEKDRFFLHGFSAGGQFAHRFFYIHPERVKALSVGCCSQITLMDSTSPWPQGLENIGPIFGKKPAASDYLNAKVQFVIGGDDDFIFRKGCPYTRRQILKKLFDDWKSKGLEPMLSVVPDVAHHGLKLLPAVFSFFASVIGLSYPPEEASS